MCWTACQAKLKLYFSFSNLMLVESDCAGPIGFASECCVSRKGGHLCKLALCVAYSCSYYLSCLSVLITFPALNLCTVRLCKVSQHIQCNAHVIVFIFVLGDFVLFVLYFVVRLKRAVAACFEYQV